MNQRALILALMAAAAVLPGTTQAADDCSQMFVYSVNQFCRTLSNGFTQCQPVGMVGPAPNCAKPGLPPIMPVPLAPPAMQAPMPYNYMAPFPAPGGVSPAAVVQSVPAPAAAPAAPTTVTPIVTPKPQAPLPAAAPSAPVAAPAPAPAAAPLPAPIVAVKPAPRLEPLSTPVQAPVAAPATPVPARVDSVAPIAVAPLAAPVPAPAVPVEVAKPVVTPVAAPAVKPVVPPSQSVPAGTVPAAVAPATPATPAAATPPLVAPATPPSLTLQDGLAHFGFNRAELSEQSRAELDAWLRQPLPKGKGVRVTGHADRIGTASYNLKLSDRRAETVKKYLVDKGVDKKDIKVVAKGESEPVKHCTGGATRATIDCLAPNRRVEVDPE